ncbi:hypothetical protein G6F66_015334 [Rhizopus arrhizus]|nr:hypothetical protein G6F66_015334 [Rhizopus arrhizus]
MMPNPGQQPESAKSERCTAFHFRRALGSEAIAPRWDPTPDGAPLWQVPTWVGTHPAAPGDAQRAQPRLRREAPLLFKGARRQARG